MWVQARVNDGVKASSPQGVADYVGVHLADSEELGELPRVHGYLDRDGRVEPIVDVDLWRRVGWDGQGLPPERLVKAVTMGCDIEGRKLSRQRSLYQAPDETVISLPSELSEALRDDPETAHELLRVALRENLAAWEEACVRRRSGQGRKTSPGWASARPLALNYCHAENRAGEVSYHAHSMVFGLALSEDGRWQSVDNRRYVTQLSKPGGARDRMTRAIIEEAARRGYQVELVAGPASAAPGLAQGARVVCPDGRVIERGSVGRTRRAEILAAQELRRELGLAPLTHREVELVRRSSGQIPAEVKGPARKEVFAAKLRALGLLDGEGCILPPEHQVAGLQTMEAGMADAQVSLADLPTLPHAREAAELVKTRRKDLVAQVPEIVPSTDAARIRWTTAYDQVLDLVAASPDGLRTDGLDKKVRDDLSKLKRAGILTGEKVAGRMVYQMTELGQARLDQGRKDQAQVERIVERLVPQAIEGADSPTQVRGRLLSLGLKVRPDQDRIEMGSVGRVLKSPELIAATGIQVDTPAAPDRAWWQRWWDRRHDLPDLLRQAIFRPEEWARRWEQAAATALGDLVRSRAFERDEAIARAAARREVERKQHEAIAFEPSHSVRNIQGPVPQHQKEPGGGRSI